jgi:hypothetical protein
MGTREGAPSLFLASLKLREKSDLAPPFSKVDLLFQTRKYLKIYGKTMYNV